MKLIYKFLTFLLPVIILLGCNTTSTLESNENVEPGSISLITISELIQKQKQVKIIDLRSKQAFSRNHITGAQLVSREEMENTDHALEGMMATSQQMQKLLSKLGIKPDDFIVLYDDNGNPEASRLFWILDFYGHIKKAILDGGYLAWKHEKKILNKQIIAVKPTNYVFSNKVNKKHYADLLEVKRAVNDTNYVIIDTRSSEEFKGTIGRNINGKKSVKEAHISNSKHIDYEENLDKNNCKRLKTIKQLRKLYASIPRNKKIICYCHSGVRSALSTFVLSEILKYPNVKNYDGSWIEWSATNN